MIRPDPKQNRVLAIDPGPEKSAWALWDKTLETPLIDSGIWNNEDIPAYIASKYHTHLAIEMIASYGMPVGKTVFETCLWIGMFLFPQIGDDAFCVNEDFQKYLVYRKDIKLHLCGSVRAKDSNIRQALIDRFGEPGTKKSPGLLHGVKKDIWSALAVAVFYSDTVLK